MKIHASGGGLCWLIFLLFILSGESAVSRDIIDTLLLKNVPSGCRMRVKEIHKNSAGVEKKREFRWFLDSAGTTSAFRYAEAAEGYSPIIVMNPPGQNVWTLDPASGRRRRISRSKIKESVIGWEMCFGDLFPGVFSAGGHRITADTAVSDSLRMVRLDTDEEWPYSEIRVYFSSASYLINRIRFSVRKRSTSRKMEFKKAAVSHEACFPFSRIILTDSELNSRTELKVISCDVMDTLPEQLVKVPFPGE